MNSDYEPQLEAEISRELKDLPNLRAPDSLVGRVLTTLERRSIAPWYCRSWQLWPASLRWTSLLLLLCVFFCLCFAGWKVSHSDMALAAMQRIGNWFCGVNTLGNALGVLANSALLVVRKLGTGFIVACFVALGLGYAVCLAVGTVYMRIGLASPAPLKQQ